MGQQAKQAGEIAEGKIKKVAKSESSKSE
jgi:hypothetical protein